MDFFEPETLGKADRPSVKPLADRMRPRSFDEFVGQDSVTGPNTPLRKAIEDDRVTSVIFWGPPGSGKTTLAELIAKGTRGQFIHFSAVASGIKEVKEVLSKAAGYYKSTGRRTYVFIDEIHRFNKAQQDAFLPYVEHGDVVLIGATTENPSFEVNSALLSRMRVYVLSRLDEESLRTVFKTAIADSERGLGKLSLIIADGALDYLASAADGDARRGLSLLEATADYIGAGGTVTVEALKEVNQRGTFVYDKQGEEHYNLISALHKTIRGGDPDAALYWMTRMLDSGEDPMYLLRRLIRFSTEDIGLADPYALTLALNSRDAYHILGSPEGELAIAQLVVYMACAPKSNALYTAAKKVQADVKEHGSLPVPHYIRNAPTGLMANLGYGQGYQYAHEFEDALTNQEYFPPELVGRQYYYPTRRGAEAMHADYLEKFRRHREKVLSSPQPSSARSGNKSNSRLK